MPKPGYCRSTMMLLACFAGAFGAASVSAKGLLGWTDEQIAKRSADHARLDPAAVARSVTSKADELDPAATLTTEPAYKFKGGFTNEVRADSFLRVFINRTTGATVWQVYQRLMYGSDRREFERADYATADGPASVRLTIADSDIRFIGTYPYHDDALAFEIPETLASEIAARAATTPATPWRFRFKSRTGADWTDDMPPAEFAGMLQAVERWRSEHPRP